MQKVSFTGNGSTTHFYFNFPYYESTDVIVTKNGQTATGYTLSGTSAGENADIPYTGGEIIFEVAPTALDTITISRKLPLTRTVDYQPTEVINPTLLNQDINYTIEVLKDFQDELDSLASQYADIADKESATNLLQKINNISQDIIDISTQLTNCSYVPAIRESITTLQNSITTLNTLTGNHTTSINALDTLTGSMLDYITQQQLPTSENNQTWYCKYKSGLIKAGGSSTTNSGNATLVTLPVQMANADYQIFIQGQTSSDGYENATWQIMPVKTAQSPRTTTSFYVQSSISGYNLKFYWMVIGTIQQ